MALGAEVGNNPLDGVIAVQPLGGVAIERGDDPAPEEGKGFLGTLIQNAGLCLGLSLGDGGLFLNGVEEASKGFEEAAVVADQIGGENDGDGDLTVIEGPDFETIPEEGRREAHRGPPSGLPKNPR